MIALMGGVCFKNEKISRLLKSATEFQNRIPISKIIFLTGHQMYITEASTIGKQDTEQEKTRQNRPLTKEPKR